MKRSASTPAVVQLMKKGVTFEELHYDHADDFEGGFGEEASQKLQITPDHVFKTLMVEVDGQPGCVLIPVSHRMSLKKVARAFGAKNAQLMPADKAQRRTGYVVGGISPFGQKTTAAMAIDRACLDLENIIVSGGRRGFSLRIKTSSFIETTGAKTADLVADEA